MYNPHPPVISGMHVCVIIYPQVIKMTAKIWYLSQVSGNKCGQVSPP